MGAVMNRPGDGGCWELHPEWLGIDCGKRKNAKILEIN